ncbi:hypothetical protein Tco_0649577 [Tanacetum coccineum]
MWSYQTLKRKIQGSGGGKVKMIPSFLWYKGWIKEGVKEGKRQGTKGFVTSLDFQKKFSTGYADGVNTGRLVSAEAIRLDTFEKEEEAKQVHLDSLLAQRLAEEEEFNEQQKQRRAQV